MRPVRRILNERLEPAGPAPAPVAAPTGLVLPDGRPIVPIGIFAEASLDATRSVHDLTSFRDGLSYVTQIMEVRLNARFDSIAGNPSGDIAALIGHRVGLVSLGPPGPAPFDGTWSASR